MSGPVTKWRLVPVEVPQGDASPVTEREFACSVCPKRYAAAWTLNKHMRTHTPTSNEPIAHENEPVAYECATCERSFTRERTRDEHIRRFHAEVRSFVCDVCDKGYVTKGRLQCHMNTHLPEKPFACERCDKRFSWAASLQGHRKNLVCAALYVCDECGKKFSKIGAFDDHHEHCQSASGT